MPDAFYTSPVEERKRYCNLDIASPVTHWACYNTVYCFDSYGNLRSPLKVKALLWIRHRVRYNYDRKQPSIRRKHRKHIVTRNTS